MFCLAKDLIKLTVELRNLGFTCIRLLGGFADTGQAGSSIWICTSKAYNFWGGR